VGDIALYIPWSDISESFWNAFILLLISIASFVVSCILAGIWVAIVNRSTKIYSQHRRAIVIALTTGPGLSFTGLIVGFLTGVSRAPAVTALVPAILSFFGLLIVYLLGEERYNAAAASFCVFVFSANIFIGATFGSASRVHYTEDPGVIERTINQEFSSRMLCKGLGLITDLSKPCSIGTLLENNKTEDKDK